VGQIINNHAYSSSTSPDFCNDGLCGKRKVPKEPRQEYEVAMIGLLQRVTNASVTADGAIVGAIGPGVLLLLGVQRGDSEREADRLLERVVTYRIFDDTDGRMNVSLLDCGGGLLVVSQFTLAAETRKGTRPGFSTAATPADGERLYEYFVGAARQRLASVATGRFGARMQVALTNDGPVTFWLEVAPAGGPRGPAGAD
jgi:D-tyrosyl-tRNA(Tyr) deacylase